MSGTWAGARGSAERSGRRRHVAVCMAAVAVLVSGCEFTGVEDLPLPFRPGAGDNAMTITVRMESAANLVPNSEVKVGDITVGTVTDIHFREWQAELTVQMNPGTELPANATATVGQKSLLGATYLELASPPEAAAVGRLRHGDIIPVTRTGDYPDTEEVLAALSLVLNGGALNQLKTITTELNNALVDRESNVRSLIDNLGRMTATLNEQRTDIVRAIDSLDRLGAKFAAQRDVLAGALERIPEGLAVLKRERPEFTRMLTAIGELEKVANRVIDGSRDDLLANLRNLQPALGRLADAGNDLTESLSILTTFPFPWNTAPNALRGDYANLFMTIDLTLPVLKDHFLSGTPLERVPVPGERTVDPLRAPIIGSHAAGSETPEFPDDNRPGAPARDSSADGFLESLLGGGD